MAQQKAGQKNNLILFRKCETIDWEFNCSTFSVEHFLLEQAKQMKAKTKNEEDGSQYNSLKY
jgi:hypothetical protein